MAGVKREGEGGIWAREGERKGTFSLVRPIFPCLPCRLGDQAHWNTIIPQATQAQYPPRPNSHNAPYLPPGILHNLCFSFLLGITEVPRKIENNAYADILNSASRILQCWSYYVKINSARGPNVVHYGKCGSSVWAGAGGCAYELFNHLYVFKWRYDRRRGNCNLNNYK